MEAVYVAFATESPLESNGKDKGISSVRHDVK